MSRLYKKWLTIAVLLIMVGILIYKNATLLNEKGSNLNRIKEMLDRKHTKRVNGENIEYMQMETSEHEEVAVDEDKHSMENFDFDYFIFLANKIFPKVGDPKFSGFNETLSHSIPLDRIGNDLRHQECKQKNWKYNTNLKVSVVIPFVNEPWSTLLRTMISVLKKSPLKQIKEVILVDDQSTRDYLLEPLERMFSSFKHLRIVRTPLNMGVARSRNYGARHAEGNVIVFLDSHCEVNIGWLEPILTAISEDPTRIAVCAMDHIDPKTLKILGTDSKSQIIFNWRMGAALGVFHPDSLKSHLITEPIPQVSLMGQVVAVERAYFFKIGGFPDYFDGWGAEDVDISIKSWLCGGGVVKCRCSHATHLQKSRPYTIKNNPSVNTKYIAETWLGEFQYINSCTVNSLDSVDTSVLGPIKDLKARLECKPFNWLLKNVFPDLEVPEPNTTFTDPFTAKGQEPLIVNSDLQTLKFSYYDYSFCTISVVNNRIKCRGKCLTMIKTAVIFKECESKNTDQIWTFTHIVIRPYSKPELCLDKSPNGTAVLEPCASGGVQIRFWTEYKPNCLK